MSRSEDIANVLRDVAKLDLEWTLASAGPSDPRNTPWMPFEVHAFIALVAEALPEARGSRFLEVGCGPGTRMLVAREIFGLDVRGVEVVPEYAKAAQSMGLDAEAADALTWDGYGEHDIIWLNRPLRDPELERQLEARVWDEAAPGAVVICANLENPPPAGWWPILDDGEVRRWIVQRPWRP